MYYLYSIKLKQQINTNIMKSITIQEKENYLISINFFVGGLTDAAIEYYYNKLN